MTALNEQIEGRHYKDLAIQYLEKAKHYVELLIELSTNGYCKNCTDINEGIFIKKLDCKCQKETKDA